MVSERFARFRDACFAGVEQAAAMLRDDPDLINARSGLGETPLHYLAVENQAEAVRFLLTKGADPNCVNEFGNSPLQDCASICSADFDLTAVVALLMKAGANPYHLANDATLCAWHRAQASDFEPLKSLFRAIPAPADEHGMCDLFGTLVDFEGESEDGPDDDNGA